MRSWWESRAVESSPLVEKIEYEEGEDSTPGNAEEIAAKEAKEIAGETAEERFRRMERETREKASIMERETREQASPEEAKEISAKQVEDAEKTAEERFRRMERETRENAIRMERETREQASPEEAEEIAEKEAKEETAEERFRRMEREMREKASIMERETREVVKEAREKADLAREARERAPSGRTVGEAAPKAPTREEAYYRKMDRMREDMGMTAKPEPAAPSEPDEREAGAVRSDLSRMALKGAEALARKKRHGGEELSQGIEELSRNLSNDAVPWEETAGAETMEEDVPVLRKASASEQAYRSIVAAGNDSDKLSQYEQFLQKEKQMRTRMNRRIVAEGKNATAVGRQIAEDVAEEFVETTRKTVIRPPKNATAVQQIAEVDEIARETKEIQPPVGSSPNAQIYRSIVANKKSQSASNQSAFDAFLQKERRMREELNMTLPVEDRQPPPTREPRRVAPAEEILLDDFFRRDASPPTDGRDAPPEDRYLKPSFEGHGLSSPAPFDYLTARKNDMLQRGEELTVEDLNALLEHVDPYDKLEIAQKPDMSHGAIFRLEGALLDMTAYYFQAWQQTFAAMNLQEQSHREPTVEDASLAQTMTVEAAVKEVFYWTHDRFEIREIQRAFHPILRRLIRDAEEPPPH